MHKVYLAHSLQIHNPYTKPPGGVEYDHMRLIALTAANILRERGVAEELIQDILSHGVDTGVPRDTRRRKALYACDEITGLVTAVALVRPSRSLLDLEPSSVKKKWKDRAFAAGTDREEMQEAAQDFGVELWEHVGNVITAMRRIAPELGLVGTSQH